jgi:uncharacterized protein YndB with AHSA1/START domain
MQTEDIKVSGLVSATPEQVFEAWLDSEGHSALTGRPAAVEAFMYGRYTAGDGYIEGITLVTERPGRIVQTWRTPDFPDSSPDSQLEVLLTPTPEGTQVVFNHTGIPMGQGEKVADGWRKFYLEPMREHFAAPAKKATRQAVNKAAPKNNTKRDLSLQNGNRR